MQKFVFISCKLVSQLGFPVISESFIESPCLRVFSFSNFKVLGFILKSSMHFERIFVQAEKYGFSYILHVDT